MNARLVIILVLLVTSLAAQDAVPDVHTVRAGSLTYDLKRPATLVPADAEELALWLDAYSGPLLVLGVIEHGTPVSAGDVLVRLDLAPFEEQLAQARYDLEQSEAELERVLVESRLQEAAAADQMDRATKDLEWARRRFKGYLEEEKAHREERDRLALLGIESSLKNQKQELAQLERMYGEDELVDATEEIVIERQRRAMAMAVARAELGKQERDYNIRVDRAIKDEAQEADMAKKEREFERNRKLAEIARARREVKPDRARRELDKKRKLVRELQADREKLQIRAPRSGIFLHGKADAAPGTGILERGSSLQNRRTFGTLARPGRLQAIADIPESKLFAVRSGAAGELRPTADPDTVMCGRLEVPIMPTGRAGEENTYRSTVAFDEVDPRFRPGMRGELRVILRTPASSLLIPKGFVTKDGPKTIVLARSGDDQEFRPREVELGPANDEMVVIEKGLALGDEVHKKQEAK
jgi:multidrug efflux pump subunit AcrA (membrane-fusion protein)